MDINFKEIRVQNFLSVGKEIVFPFNNGIDLIVGTNGTGKSLISSDAIFYSLFGKPYRKVKTGSLQNKINKKKLQVTLDFTVDGAPYRIVRGMNPNIFKIYKDGTNENDLIPQNATIKEYQKYLEEYVICTNETIIRQLMILGTNSNSSKPFLELNATEKEEMFSTITDTQIFGYMKDIIKKKVQENKTQVTELNYKVNLLVSTISSEKVTIEQMKRQNEDFNKNHDIRKQQILDEIIILEANIAKYTEGLLKLKAVKTKYDANITEMNGLIQEKNGHMSLRNSLQVQKQHIESAEHNAIVCEECQHTNYLVEVDVTNKDYLESEFLRISELEDKVDIEINEIRGISDKQKEGLLNGKRIKQNIDDFKVQVQQKNAQIEQMNAFKPIEITYDEIQKKEDDLVQAKDALTVFNEKIIDYTWISQLVSSDNLKGLIISKQLPILNKFINMYLEKFSLLGYNFIVDKDFKEHIISRGEEAEFNLLSNGQKARISFAIMFAFLRLIEERNGTRLNILTLDEALDSSLDATGRDELLDILKNEFSKEKDIIIVSHNADIKEKIEIFSRIVTTSKDTFTSYKIENI